MRCSTADPLPVRSVPEFFSVTDVPVTDRFVTDVPASKLRHVTDGLATVRFQSSGLFGSGGAVTSAVFVGSAVPN